MKEGIYIGKNNKDDTLLIKVSGEAPFLKVDYWNVSLIDGKTIVNNADSKLINQIDWDNVKKVEE